MKLEKWYNTLTVFSFLLLNGLYYSEIGGTESYYRKLMLLNGFLFLFVNAGYLRKLFFAFLIPILLVISSFVFNYQAMGVAAINSTFYTILGFLLLGMKPIVISETQMSKLIVIGLIVSMGLSFVAVVNAFYTYELFTGFSNFNINPNQAGIFFYTCITGAIYFYKNLEEDAGDYSFLSAGTNNRIPGNLYMLYFSIIIFRIIYCKKRGHRNFQKEHICHLQKFFGNWFIFGGTYIFLTGLLRYLFDRLMTVGLSAASVQKKGEGRDILWEQVFALINDSPAAWVFGFGPASIDSMIGRSTHNSFVDAIATKGLPFLVFTLIGTMVLIYYHYRKRHLIVVFSIFNILIYGYTTTDLFGGIGTLWGLIIFLSLWTRSLTKNGLSLFDGNNSLRT